MVECPVGNRCRQCAGKFTSHVLKVSPAALARTFAAAVVIGFLFGGLETVYPFYGFYMFIFIYLIGYFAGNFLNQIAGNKMGNKLAMTVACGIAIGCFVSPVHSSMFGAIGMSSPFGPDVTQSTQTTIESYIDSDQDTAAKAESTNLGDKDPAHKKVVAADLAKEAAAEKRAEAIIRAMNARQVLSRQSGQGGVNNLIAMAIFAFGAASPFMGWLPAVRNPFQR